MSAYSVPSRSISERRWHQTHPGRTLTIQEVDPLVTKAFGRAFTIPNIVNSFRTTGMGSTDANVFSVVIDGKGGAKRIPSCSLQHERKKLEAAQGLKVKKTYRPLFTYESDYGNGLDRPMTAFSQKTLGSLSYQILNILL